MLEIKSKITRRAGLIDLSSTRQGQDGVVVLGSSKQVSEIIPNFSLTEVQRIFEGNITFHSNGKPLHSFEQIDLLEFFYYLLVDCHNLMATNTEFEFVFPNSDHRLKLTPNQSASDLVSTSLFYTNMDDVYFEQVDVSFLTFYRSVWHENAKLLDNLHQYQPELFQYLRFTALHPNALRLANRNLQQIW